MIWRNYNWHDNLLRAKHAQAKLITTCANIRNMYLENFITHVCSQNYLNVKVYLCKFLKMWLLEGISWINHILRNFLHSK